MARNNKPKQTPSVPAPAEAPVSSFPVENSTPHLNEQGNAEGTLSPAPAGDDQMQQLQQQAEANVLAVRGSHDAPGFDANVEAEKAALLAEQTPQDEPAPIALGSPETVTVKYGDTLEAISEAYGVSVDKLKKLNPRIEGNNKIFINQVLVLK